MGSLKKLPFLLTRNLLGRKLLPGLIRLMTFTSRHSVRVKQQYSGDLERQLSLKN